MQTLPAPVQSSRVIQLVHAPSHPYLSTSSLCTSPFMMSDTQAMAQWVTRLSQHLNSESQHRGHNLITFALEAAGVAHCVGTPTLLEALPKVLPRVTLRRVSPVHCAGLNHTQLFRDTFDCLSRSHRTEPTIIITHLLTDSRRCGCSANYRKCNRQSILRLNRCLVPV